MPPLNARACCKERRVEQRHLARLLARKNSATAKEQIWHPYIRGATCLTNLLVTTHCLPHHHVSQLHRCLVCFVWILFFLVKIRLPCVSDFRGSREDRKPFHSECGLSNLSYYNLIVILSVLGGKYWQPIFENITKKVHGLNSCNYQQSKLTGWAITSTDNLSVVGRSTLF